MKDEQKIWKEFKRNYWSYIFGLVMILLLISIKLAFNIDTNNIHEYYKNKMDECQCYCPEGQTNNIIGGDIIGIKDLSQNTEEPSKEIS